MALSVFHFLDGCGFYFFDAVQESVESCEFGVVVDADLSEGGLEAESVVVEDVSGFRLFEEEADYCGEVFDGVHFGVPFLCMVRIEF